MGVPRKFTPQVKEFCCEIFADGEPVYLDVILSEQGIAPDCFMNVEKQLLKAGGSIQYGWRIWEWSNTLIEAEFHAVWRTPDNTLVDITPAPKDFRRILFLPDSSRVYEGQQIDNIRKSLYKHKLVDEFIQLWKEQFEIYNKGERASMHGEMSVRGAEARRLLTIKRRIAEIQKLLSLCPSLLRK